MRLGAFLLFIFLPCVLSAQIGEVWIAVQGAGEVVYIGSADLDDDPQDEAVFLKQEGDRRSIVIFDGSTGEIDWRSAEYASLTVPGLNGESGPGSPFIELARGRRGLIYIARVDSAAREEIVLVSLVPASADQPAAPGRETEGREETPAAPLRPAQSTETTDGVEIVFTSTEADYARISIIDEWGRQVREITMKDVEVGVNTFTWDGNDDNGNRVSAGRYDVQVRVGETVSVKKTIRIE